MHTSSSWTKVVLAGLLGVCIVAGGCNHHQVKASSEQGESDRVISEDGASTSYATPLEAGIFPSRGPRQPGVYIMFFSNALRSGGDDYGELFEALMVGLGGQVRLDMIPAPRRSDEDAIRISRGVIAAYQQGAYAEYRQLVIEGFPYTKGVFEYARILGLDMEKFGKGFEGITTRQLVNRGISLAEQYGVERRPGVMVNWRLLPDDIQVEELRTAVRREAWEIERLMATGMTRQQALIERASTRDTETAAKARQYTEVRYRVPVGASQAVGPDDALVTWVIFAHHSSLRTRSLFAHLATLYEQHPDELRLVFKHPGPHSTERCDSSARAIIAAGNQGHYLDYWREVFAEDEYVEDEELLAGARQLGLDMATFDQERGGDMIGEQLHRETVLASRLLVDGHPSSYVNGQEYKGVMDVERVRTIFEQHREQALALVEQGVNRGLFYEHLQCDVRWGPGILHDQKLLEASYQRMVCE